jgi:2-keto-3-deoxy-6-phosphogluconate aldolase
MMMALNAGITLAKFFPFFENGGEEYLNITSSPFPNLRFIVTGSMDSRHLSYLTNPRIAAIGGVWMFSTETDHTLKSESEIITVMEKSVKLAKYYKNYKS